MNAHDHPKDDDDEALNQTPVITMRCHSVGVIGSRERDGLDATTSSRMRRAQVPQAVVARWPLPKFWGSMGSLGRTRSPRGGPACRRATHSSPCFS